MNALLDQKIIDTHIHLWDLKKNSYDWITHSSNKKLKESYLLDKFITDIGDLKVFKAIHIQAEINREFNIEETKWLQTIADNNILGFPNGIIGYVDLSQKDAEYLIDQHIEYSNFRGIRQILKYNAKEDLAHLNLLKNRQWIENLKILQKKKLTFDLLINYYQFQEASQVIKKYENLQFIINHTLWPIGVGEDKFNLWKDSLTKLSELDNVAIKLSGFGERDPLWNKDNIQPFINFVLEKFTINRCMFGSNFPVDRSFSEKKYIDYWDAYHTIISSFTETEKDLLFYKNAELFYRI